MDDTQETPLATGPLGMSLLSFRRGPEENRPDDHPLGYALVALWQGDRVLLVLERERRCWELPGGGIEPGETAREAAVRELQEEAGQHLHASDLHFAGFARTRLFGRGQMYGAVFTARTDAPEPFTPNEEIAAVHWHRRNEPLPDGGMLQTVDTYLAFDCRP
ncbi:NUDIX hydrolase [Streptomyces sp. TR06-5]|uniref:NUDIX hydrolase n=1 Tax=unclassified Streptomyces TaxID=2593676 RepID=UPI0039A29FAB